MKPIWIYGAVPAPMGGVSVFIHRLLQSRALDVAGLIDPYFGKKVDIEVQHITPRRPGLLARFCVMLRLVLLRRQSLLINGSVPAMAILIRPFLLARHAPTLLLLHHGQLGSVREMSWARRHMLLLALAVYDAIACLSEDQWAFYRDLGIAEDRLTVVDIYLPPAGAGHVALSKNARDAIEWIESGRGGIIIGSGYALKSYNHEWVLDALQTDASLHDMRYLLCCYGPETEYLGYLRSRFASLRNARLVFQLSPEEFDVVLGLCDIYARPTNIDSFGIAVRDAAVRGLVVVASDICERPLGALIHRAGDKSDFTHALCLAKNKISGEVSDIRNSSSIERKKFSEFLTDLLSVDDEIQLEYE